MEIQIKAFSELNVQELYDILQLRAEVFVVEQDCVYQDIDGKDNKALHVLGKLDKTTVAYARCFDKGIYFTEAAIGRVVVKKNARKHGYGHKIMQASIETIEQFFKTKNIKISAQEYLRNFYKFHGFEQIGEGYMEDGIPHIGMVKN